MDELKYNAEHYRDKTTQKAVRRVDYEADMARLNTVIMICMRGAMAYYIEDKLNYWKEHPDEAPWVLPDIS